MLIGERIRVARKRLGKTQAELAIDIESHANSVGRWESGERNPTIDDLDRLAVAMGFGPPTVHRWAHGQRAPRGPALRLIGLVFDQHKVPRPWPR